MRRTGCQPVVWAAVWLVGCGGCVELGLITPVVNLPDEAGGGEEATDTTPPPAEETPPPLPAVTLTVSNAAPVVNEEVLLACVPEAAPPAGATFAFAPADRLAVDAERGTASFVVAEADVGVEFPFTCRSVREGEEGPVSNTVTVIPVGEGASLPPVGEEGGADAAEMP